MSNVRQHETRWARYSCETRSAIEAVACHSWVEGKVAWLVLCWRRGVSSLPRRSRGCFRGCEAQWLVVQSLAAERSSGRVQALGQDRDADCTPPAIKTDY